MQPCKGGWGQAERQFCKETPECVRAPTLRCFGSSLGSGREMSFEALPVSSIVNSANCLIVNSFGLPTLIGPVVSSFEEDHSNDSKMHRIAQVSKPHV